MINWLIILSNYNKFLPKNMWSWYTQMKWQAVWLTTQGDRIEADAVLCSAYTSITHIYTKHRHIVHISLIHAVNYNQVCCTHYTQTDEHIRLPTISPPIRHQTAVWGFPARAFDLVKWVSLGYMFLPSPSISKHQFVPIADYPSYLEAISSAD